MAATIFGDLGSGSLSEKKINDSLLGQYSLGTFTGLIAAGVTGELFQFRWADTTRLAAIRKVVISATASTPFGATPASSPLFQLYRANSWTVQGTGGFAANPIATNDRKSSMPASLVQTGDIRMANTAALGAGTKTFANPPLAAIIGCPVSAITYPVLPPTEIVNYKSDFPLILGTNEGFIVNLSTNPGTGTLIFGVAVDWAETAA